MGRKMMTRVFPLALLCVFVLATAAFCGVTVTILRKNIQRESPLLY